MNLEPWIEELKSSIATISELEKILKLTNQEKMALHTNKDDCFKITPHILNLIKYNDKTGKIRRQFIPTTDIVQNIHGFQDDYLCEADNEVCKNLITRYPYKAILLVTLNCPTYCQFCTRKRIVNDNEKSTDLNEAYAYLLNHPEIYDVVITGGDPLMLNDHVLEEIFLNLRMISSIRIIRLNTRAPVTIPKRITSNLIKLLKKYRIDYINIHFEHPAELTDDTIEACLRLANNGILLGSQSVLLKGINDDKETLKELFLKLLLAKVRPYYLYQCDKVTGCQSFYTNPKRGIDLINSILYELPGLCVPRFVIDSPDRMGKITVAPNGLVGREPNKMQLKNFHNGEKFMYEFYD